MSDLTIHIGSWAIPALVTIAAVGFALYAARSDGKSYGYAAVGQGVIASLLLMGAIIVSLIAWLVWAVIR